MPSSCFEPDPRIDIRLDRCYKLLVRSQYLRHPVVIKIFAVPNDLQCTNGFRCDNKQAIRGRLAEDDTLAFTPRE